MNYSYQIFFLKVQDCSRQVRKSPPPRKRVLIRSWWSGAWVGHCREWWREGEAQFKALRCKCSNIIYIKLSYLQVYFQHHCPIYSLKSLIEIVLRIFLECPQTYFVTSRGTQSRPSSVEEITTNQHSNIDRPSWVSVFCPLRQRNDS